MRLSQKADIPSSLFVKLKDQNWLDRQRVAGRVTARALQILQQEVINNTTATMLELSSKAEEYILSQDCTATFKGYKGFPAAVCISINKQLVHGIPTDYRLQDGDVVSFDLGATYKGAIADSAITCIYGAAKDKRHVELLEVTKQSLDLAIEQVAAGKYLGCIGHTIYRHARDNNLSVVVDYGGHGICEDKPHAQPFVANRSEVSEGIVMQAGLTLAIEPMFVIGNSNKTKTLNDKWTIVTEDIGAHFEHTIFVHNDHVEIITQME